MKLHQPKFTFLNLKVFEYILTNRDLVAIDIANNTDTSTQTSFCVFLEGKASLSREGTGETVFREAGQTSDTIRHQSIVGGTYLLEPVTPAFRFYAIRRDDSAVPERNTFEITGGESVISPFSGIVVEITGANPGNVSPINANDVFSVEVDTKVTIIKD